MVSSVLVRLSFSIVASKIKEKARVVAMDLRGHGKSVSENELELSLEVWHPCSFWESGFAYGIIH